MVLNAVELIERKRDGLALEPDEIEWFVASATTAVIPTYQISAMLMAIFLRGLDAAELAVWTAAMLRSGDVMDFSDVPGPKVDKHSTGGVGDKVSIPLVPLAAVCGLVVPMISGRGLAHTGGTLDKLESIPGFRTALDPEEFRSVIEGHSLAMAGQSETLVPADRLFYALRDASGTVPSIPLISSSIMSKKLAEGLDALVLDVKVGEGAFMKDLDSARELAETMVGIGAAHGVEVTALLTSMDQPLGREVGNASEIRESVDVLRGTGPEDLTALVLRLAAEMLVAGGLAGSREEAMPRVEEAISSGAGLAKLEEIVEAQDGDPAALTDWTRLPTARSTTTHVAPRSGTVTRCGALPIGVAAMRLGAGREVAEDTVDPSVGITVLAKVGDQVSEGEPLAEISYNDDERLQAARALLDTAWEIEDRSVTAPRLILETIT